MVQSRSRRPPWPILRALRPQRLRIPWTGTHPAAARFRDVTVLHGHSVMACACAPTARSRSRCTRPRLWRRSSAALPPPDSCGRPNSRLPPSYTTRFPSGPLARVHRHSTPRRTQFALTGWRKPRSVAPFPCPEASRCSSLEGGAAGYWLRPGGPGTVRAAYMFEPAIRAVAVTPLTTRR